MKSSGAILSFFQFFRTPEEDPRKRFILATWSLALVVSGVVVLSSMNPFDFVIPGGFYPKVNRDHRSLIPMGAMTAGTSRPVSIQRYLLLTGDPDSDVRKITFLLSKPLEPEEIKATATIGNLRSFPLFGFALRKVWYLKTTSGRLLTMDFRTRTLDSELEKYQENRTETANEKRAEILDDYFEVLSRSLFMNDADLKEIRFLLDGKSQGIPGMEFPLDRPHLPEEFTVKES